MRIAYELLYLNRDNINSFCGTDMYAFSTARAFFLSYLKGQSMRDMRCVHIADDCIVLACL